VKVRALAIVRVFAVLIEMPLAEVGLAMVTELTVELAFITGVEPETIVTLSPEPTPLERQV